MDGVLSQEEIQDIANNDDDSELFSYDDILLLTEELFPQENEKEIQNEIPPTVKTPSSPSGGGARINNNSSNTDSSSVSTKANSPQETPKMISKDELNKQLEEAKADLETKQQELDAVNNETDPELVSLKEKEQKAYEAHQQETINLENMTQELTNLTTQITQLDSDILNLENSIATIEQTISNLNAQAGASEDAEAFQSQIQAEQDKLETAKINLENLKSQKETLEAQKETLEMQIAEKNTQIATLLEEYNNAKAEFEKELQIKEHYRSEEKRKEKLAEFANVAPNTLEYWRIEKTLKYLLSYSDEAAQKEISELQDRIKGQIEKIEELKKQHNTIVLNRNNKEKYSYDVKTVEFEHSGWDVFVGLKYKCAVDIKTKFTSEAEDCYEERYIEIKP